jgi:hypothetical protein
MSGIVTARGLVKRYDRTIAVAGLDLDVADDPADPVDAPGARCR